MILPIRKTWDPFVPIVVNAIAVPVSVSLATRVNSVNAPNVMSIVILTKPIAFVVNVYANMVGPAIVATVKIVQMAALDLRVKYARIGATVSVANVSVRNHMWGSFVKSVRKPKINSARSLSPV